ncbi:MAG: histidine triad nucleotide-binding protein [Ignavibacteriae bacterium]|nr:MAG: histidine triad nucleotide-binding protein [Ignavibacteriota bacterium]
MENCIFCKIARGEIPAKIVKETDELVAFNDLSPQAPHHVLIIPKQHISTLAEINENNYELMGKIVLTASEIAKELNLEGYRIVANCNEIAGQSVFHIHFHLLGGRQMHWPPG